MKKQLVAYLILLVISAQFVAHFGYMKAQAQVIPNDAIRLRILANSDSDEDQALKRKVRDRVKEQIDTWVADLHSIDEARTIIKSRIPQLEKTVAQVLKEEKSNQTFTVEFNKHIKFPTKLYGNFIYPAGEYEAVLVKLGKGEGANWWCVLFPPLCFLDFSSGTAIPKDDTVKAKEVQDEQANLTTTDTTDTNTEETKAPEKIPYTKTNKPVLTKSVDKTSHMKQASSKVSDNIRLAKEEKLFQQDTDNTAETEKKQQPIQVDTSEEPQVKVKFFIVEVISSLFSK